MSYCNAHLFVSLKAADASYQHLNSFCVLVSKMPCPFLPRVLLQPRLQGVHTTYGGTRVRQESRATKSSAKGVGLKIFISQVLELIKSWD